MCRFARPAKVKLSDIAAIQRFSSELRPASVNQTAMPYMNTYCTPPNTAALFGAVAATLLCAMQALADPPIAREEIRVVEKEIVQQAAQIDAETAKSVDALRAGGSVKEIHNGMNSVFDEWKTAARRLSLSPRQTPLGTKVSLMHKNAALGGDAWKDADGSLQSGWDGVVNDLGRDLETRKKAIEDAFELVNDAGQRVARPVAAREQLVNQTCNGFQASLDNATKKLASSYLDVIRKAVDGLDRGLKEQEEKHKAAEDAKAAAVLAKQAAEQAAKEAARQKLLAEKQAQEQEMRRRMQKPSWDGVEDLNAALEPFDGDLRAYVEFGTPENAEKGRGDRFDRIEAKKAATKHRNALDGKRFAWTAGSYRCRDGDEEADGDPGKNGDLIRQTLMIYLPFRIADTEKRLSTSVKVGNGKNAVFALMKDGSMQQLFDQRVIDKAEADNVALYIGDAETSFVQVLVEGKLEDIKRLVREPENHVVQFRLSNIAVRKPKAWGYYLKSAMNKAEGHYPWVQASGLAQKAAGKDRDGVTLDFISQRDVPELVMAQLDGIEVARVDSQKRETLFSVPVENPIGSESPPPKATQREETNPPTQKPLIASLLGHWVTEDGSTHRYFSSDTVIMVDEDRVRPQSYRIVKSDEQAGTMTISCEGRNDRYSLPGARPVFYDLEFSKDRKAAATRTYLRETDDPVEGKWTYVDAAREP